MQIVLSVFLCGRVKHVTDASLVCSFGFNGIFLKILCVTELVAWSKLSLPWRELSAGSACPVQILLSTRGLQPKVLVKVGSIVQLCSKEMNIKPY